MLQTGIPHLVQGKVQKLMDAYAQDIYTQATQRVALRIRELCFLHGLTLPELAERSGMPMNSMRDILSGKNGDIRFSSLIRIMIGLNADPAYFFDSKLFESRRDGRAADRSPGDIDNQTR